MIYENVSTVVIGPLPGVFSVMGKNRTPHKVQHIRDALHIIMDAQQKSPEIERLRRQVLNNADTSNDIASGTSAPATPGGGIESAHRSASGDATTQRIEPTRSQPLEPASSPERGARPQTQFVWDSGLSRGLRTTPPEPLLEPVPPPENWDVELRHVLVQMHSIVQYNNVDGVLRNRSACRDELNRVMDLRRFTMAIHRVCANPDALSGTILRALHDMAGLVLAYRLLDEERGNWGLFRAAWDRLSMVIGQRGFGGGA